MKTVRANLTFAQRFVSEKLMKGVLQYIEANPEVNFPRLLTFLRPLVPEEKHKHQITKVLEAYQTNPDIHKYINRFFSLHPNAKNRLIYNWFMNAQFLGLRVRRQVEETTGLHVPNFILLDPTSRCNLRCKGCWAGAYAQHDEMSLELVDRVCSEGKELGIYWMAMSGGEPFMWPHLITLAERHSDLAFMLYTNGTLIDGPMADRLQEVGNISPTISLEGEREATDARRGHGVYDRIMQAMDNLRERGLPFGISITISRDNVEEVTSDAFIEHMMEKGALYGWSFHYIPIGRDPNPDLMITPEQRAYLVERIHTIRTRIGLQIADFWNDGDLTGGCLSGGRHYFHVTASGQIEPCAFVHFTMGNIRDHTLVEVLKSPLMKAFQSRQPMSDNLLRPCPIIDVPELLREIVEETGAQPSHPGAETVLQGPIAEILDARAMEWKAVADAIWQERHPEATTASTVK